MSSSPTSTSASASASASNSSLRSKKIVIPKVWKRPHSTIYGKNVEFGSSLYSDKIGEINGRKLNNEYSHTLRNSPSSYINSGHLNQGYLSNLLVDARDGCKSYADLLAITNPNNRSSFTNSKYDYRKRLINGTSSNEKIDFYKNHENFTKEIDRLNNSSLLMNEHLLTRKEFDQFLDYDYDIGLFVPKYNFIEKHDKSFINNNNKNLNKNLDIYKSSSFVPMTNSSQSIGSLENYDLNEPIYKSNYQIQQQHQTHNPFNCLLQNTQLLPKHRCQLASSPYGQSADGRKLSLSSISPHSYRPTLPQKTSVAHASDGEEFELQDKSSPFYTDRWAGRTIRHFDSDLYSNANLFKSMIL